VGVPVSKMENLKLKKWYFPKIQNDPRDLFCWACEGPILVCLCTFLLEKQPSTKVEKCGFCFK